MTLPAAVLSDRLSVRDAALLALHLSGITASEISRLQVRDLRPGNHGSVLVYIRSAKCDTCGRIARLSQASAVAVSRFYDEEIVESSSSSREPLFQSAGRRPLSKRGVQWVLSGLREASR